MARNRTSGSFWGTPETSIVCKPTAVGAKIGDQFSVFAPTDLTMKNQSNYSTLIGGSGGHGVQVFAADVTIGGVLVGLDANGRTRAPCAGSGVIFEPSAVGGSIGCPESRLCHAAPVVSANQQHGIVIRAAGCKVHRA